MGIFDDFFNELRGKSGEKKIARKLNALDFFGYDGRCLRNLYIPREDGSTSEIDVVYITSKGIFVIESKNYSGYIFGNEHYKNWTSTLYAGKTWYGGNRVEKYHFFNPVWQNKSHVKAIRGYLGEVKTYSFIVFGSDCELKDVSVSNEGVYVCTASGLKSLFKAVWNSEPNVYSDSQVADMYNRLVSLTNVDRQVKNKHIQDIKYRQNNMSLICPWCGGELVLRTAKKGTYAGKNFYGCSNYPKCKFILNP